MPGPRFLGPSAEANLVCQPDRLRRPKTPGGAQVVARLGPRGHRRCQVPADRERMRAGKQGGDGTGDGHRRLPPSLELPATA